MRSVLGNSEVPFFAGEHSLTGIIPHFPPADHSDPFRELLSRVYIRSHTDAALHRELEVMMTYVPNKKAAF